jgi:hypothetical protein
MRLRLWLILILQAALVALLAVGVKTGLMPLGIRGEWEWLRLGKTALVSWDWLALAGLGVAAYAGFAGLGLRALAARATGWAEARWLAALLAAAIAVQVAIPMGAAPGYDLSKWASVNYLPGSAGYFQVARQQAVRDPWRFLAEYPEWIRSQDSLHIGTHPPGLIIVQCVLLEAMERSAALADVLLDHMPPSVEAGFRAFAGQDPQPLTRAERAALYATSLLTLLACAGAVVPLYLLARAGLPAPAAWAAAALWPMAPAANLFQPVADTCYPFLSTSAWALAAWSVPLLGAALQTPPVGRPEVSRGATCPPKTDGSLAGLLLAVFSGIVMAFGMVFTLAFLPVGLIAALIIVSDRSLSLTRRAALIFATGAGFLVVVLGGWLATGADPFVVWLWNLHHHARFYDEYPRTYSLWLWANLIELAIAIGLPVMVWLVAGLLSARTVPWSVWATLLVLALVNLTGRNLGEVARLWMLFMTPLLLAAGHGLHRLGGGPVALAVSSALVGVQTLALQSMIQVVYPV